MVQLINPTWRSLNSGGQTVDREGTLLLEFAEPLPSGTAPGERRYNWDKKQVRMHALRLLTYKIFVIKPPSPFLQTIGLSAMELGKLLDPGPERKLNCIMTPTKAARAFLTCPARC